MINNNHELFYLVWHNIYIRKLILYFLKVYNIFSSGIRTFESFESVFKFQKKEFLKQIIIDNNSKIKELIFNKADKNNINSSFLKIPYWIELLHLPSYYDLSILKDAFNLHTLCLYGNENIDIPPNTLPNSITDLRIFGYSFTILKDVLPKNLIKFSYSVRDSNTINEYSLPEGLEELTLHLQIINDQFPLKSKYLPKSLKVITFDSIFDLEIPKYFELPPSLQKLSVKCKELNFKLPPTIKHLTLRVYRSYIDENSLPPSLEHLSISTLIINDAAYSYQQISHKLISSNIKSLVLGNNTPIIDKFGISILPKYLKTLSLRNCNERLFPNLLPQSLTYLNFQSTFASFDNGGYPLLEEGIFSNSLIYINFGASFNQILGNNVLPKSGNLKTVIFGCCFNQFLPQDSIPQSVTSLVIKNSKYDHHLFFPNNPNTIIKTENINKYIKQFESKPDQLIALSLPVFFNAPISTLSLNNKTNLQILIFDFEFNQDLIFDQLPFNNSIRYLEVGKEFNKVINLDYFKNLETLVIYGSNAILQTTITTSNNNDQSNSIINTYNFYSLKIIEVDCVTSTKFLDILDPIFYQFVKLIKRSNKVMFR